MFRFYLVKDKQLGMKWETSQILSNSNILTRYSTLTEVEILSTGNEQFCAQLNGLIENGPEWQDHQSLFHNSEPHTKIKKELKVQVGILPKSYNYTRDYIRVWGTKDRCILTRLENVLNGFGFWLKVTVDIQKFGYGSGQCHVSTKEVEVSELSSKDEVVGTFLYYSACWDKEYWEPANHHVFWGTVSITCVAFRKQFEGFFYTTPTPEAEAGPYVFQKLLRDGKNSDATIFASEGEEIKCHKLILRGQSEVFEAMFRNDKKSKESFTGVVHMEDVCSKSVNAFLTFLYLDDLEEATQDCSVALDVLKTAHKYNVPRLEERMRQAILAKPHKWFNVEMTMQLFVFAKNIPDGDALMKRAAQVLKSNPSDLDDSPSYNQMFIEHPDAARDLCGYFVTL